MSRIHRSKWAAGLAMLSLLAAALPLAAQTFSAGNDAWSTPSGGQTQVNLSDFPGVLSALGSSISGGNTINVQGVAVNSSSLGSMDTIMTRGAIASGTGNLTIVALNLVSSSNLTLADGRVYSMQLCLSDTASPTGSLTLTRASGDGGTFVSSFQVLPKMVFTNIHNSSDVITVDCAGGGCDTVTMGASNAGWVQTGGPGNFNPNAEGILPMPTGNYSVANCGGSHTVSLSGSGGFYPGWTGGSGGSAHRAGGGVKLDASSSGTFTPSPVNHGTITANHVVKPPQDCLPAQRMLPQGIKPDLATRPACPVINPSL